MGSAVRSDAASAGIRTPIEVMVTRRKGFVCRAEFSSDVKQERQGELYVFTYGMDSGEPAEGLHLSSAEATVVIDNLGGPQWRN